MCFRPNQVPEASGIRKTDDFYECTTEYISLLNKIIDNDLPQIKPGKTCAGGWLAQRTLIALDRAERVVRRLGAGMAEGVQERRFADVRKADDADREPHRDALSHGKIGRASCRERV